jgi:hypothetical protein
MEYFEKNRNSLNTRPGTTAPATKHPQRVVEIVFNKELNRQDASSPEEELADSSIERMPAYTLHHQRYGMHWQNNSIVNVQRACKSKLQRRRRWLSMAAGLGAGD